MFSEIDQPAIRAVRIMAHVETMTGLSLPTIKHLEREGDDGPAVSSDVREAVQKAWRRPALSSSQRTGEGRA